MDRQEENAGFIKRTYISMDDAELFSTVEAMMRQKKVYLDPHLTMESLAGHIGVHRNSLSRAVNRHAGESFPAYLARYRVEEAGKLVGPVLQKQTKHDRTGLAGGFQQLHPFLPGD